MFVLLVNSLCANAAQVNVLPTENLQQVLDNASNGDEIVLNKGTYRGNFVIKHSIQLTGKAGAVIDAQGQGHALLLQNSDITIKNLRIINWGDDLTEQNAGIYSDNQASNIVISHNQLKGDGFGIWLQKATRAKVIGNTIQGNTALRSADRGNGIQLASVKESIIAENETSKVRDGIYVQASQNNTIEKNTMHDLRYGIHYMYSYDNSILNNLAYNTRAGYAMMSSRRLKIAHNKSFQSEDYGFLLNYITQSTISHNYVKDVWTKPEHKVLGRDGKGLFVYNSGYNTISHNLVDTAEIGIHLTAGSEKVKIFGNSFINNPLQVKYVSNKKQEWSYQQQGNFWSNYLGWDMNSDDIGDVIFEPNDGIDKLVWQYPEMKMLMDSPAVIILRWVQRQFPVLKPPGVKDSFPLMRSPHQKMNINEVINNTSKDETLVGAIQKIEH
ncbi:nitrous oxide reductase family maturation protein NosD [Thalassotalea sp. G2M2-11]|uniref:nitrous oxide reductase family maturation protein NosD n=1 Tax=Thalassotalea sp. G2M2-11 TaxID=2787627 RepID=UPI001F49CDAB|nr:nitrous oxide reductase family maturation protein NosD [Thalassotalea sp. G2M2-11]